MKMKSATGSSSVHLPGSPSTNNASIKIVDGKKIVHKPINTHRANPGFKKGK